MLQNRENAIKDLSWNFLRKDWRDWEKRKDSNDLSRFNENRST